MFLLSPVNVLPSLDCEGAESQSAGSQTGPWVLLMLADYITRDGTSSPPGLLLSD